MATPAAPRLNQGGAANGAARADTRPPGGAARARGPHAPACAARASSHNPRTANGHRRRELRAWLAAQGEPCHICGQPIDYSLEWWVDPRDGRRKRHPMSFEVDEVVPVSLGGDPLDRSNVRAAHRICNERRGNAPVNAGRASSPPQALRTSRDW